MGGAVKGLQLVDFVVHIGVLDIALGAALRNIGDALLQVGAGPNPAAGAAHLQDIQAQGRQQVGILEAANKKVTFRVEALAQPDGVVQDII